MAYSFDAEDADFVLVTRSSDQCKEFRVHKCILSIASPVFRGMFLVPQPLDSTQKLPRIELPETTETIDLLLRYIYPIPSPKIEDFVTLTNVLASADKYGAEGVTSRLRTVLVSRLFLDLNPLRVYAIACRWSFLDEAKLASTCIVYADLVKLGEDCTEDMRYMSGLDHHRLLALRQARMDAIQRAVASQPVPVGQCCSFANGEVGKLLVGEMLRKKFELSDFLSTLDTSGKAKPCKVGACPLGRVKVEAFVMGAVNGLGELPSSI